MGIYKSETKKMEFNGYNYKAEWIIDNFHSFIGNEYLSPLFACDNFQVQLSLQNSLKKDSDSLEITFNFVSVSSSGLILNYSIQIENKYSSKTEKINGDETLSDSKKEFKVSTKTKSKDITDENGFLQDGKLKITCFFKSNSGFDMDSFDITEPKKYKKEVVCESDWYIKENISEFHSTEEPFEVSIQDKIVKYALTFELTEDDTYLLSIFLVDPEIYFNGELEVILNNYKDLSKNISKNENIQFTSANFDIQPISFNLKQEDFTNPENGWIIYDNATSEVQKGVHFTIKFKTLKREEENKDLILYRLAQVHAYNEKLIREKYPITIKPVYSNNFKYDIDFPNFLSNDLSKPITSPEYHTGGFCCEYQIDLMSNSFYFNITDFTGTGGFLTINVTILNNNPASSKKFKYSILYCPSKRSERSELPFTLDDLKNPDKGWLFDGTLRINASYSEKNSKSSYLYPVTSNASMNGLYVYKFLIPYSLFSKENENKFIDFPSVIAKQLNATPFITYRYDDETNKINIRTQFDLKYPKDSIVDFIFAYENKDQDKNFIITFTDVFADQLQIADFIPEKSLKEDGFVFLSEEENKEVLNFFVRIHFEERNSYYSSYHYSSHAVISPEQKEAQEENKLPTMLPETSLNINEQAQMQQSSHYNPRHKHLKNNRDDSIDIDMNFNDSSKKETGYVGLNNQGATCYMNSLLQSLYHLPAFRRLVYEMPTTGTEDANISIPLNLQRLFCQMQFSSRSCSTVNLTKSFGWGSAETFQQHDIEEFLRVLIDNLENKMQGTSLQDSIPRLFRGRYRNYIKCKNVDYRTVKEENFYDLSMEVKGIPNLLDSFKNYVKPEELTGDNKYSTEKYGKQDAIMGVEFVEFPPVLHLQLIRFTYDPTQPTGMTKINDRFEFPESIDLTDFLAMDSPCRDRSNIYDLYGVLVHSGGALGGHYYAFLRTSTSPQWYKFNDSHVSKDSVENAVFDNFGNPAEKEEENDENDDENHFLKNEMKKLSSAQMGIDICGGRREEDVNIHDPEYEWQRHKREVFDAEHFKDIKKNAKRGNNRRRNFYHGERYYSGYLLVYVRREDAESIFEPISDESVPDHLKAYIENKSRQQNEQLEKNIKEKTTLKVELVHENILRTNSVNRILGFFPSKSRVTQKEEKEEAEAINDIDISTKSFTETYDKTISTSDLYNKVASKLSLDPSRIRLWRCGYGNLPKRTIPNSEKANLAGISEGKNEMKIFVQPMKEENEKLDIGDKYMFYIKFFFSEDLLKRQNIDENLLQKELQSPLQYIFSIPANRNSTVSSLVPIINEKLGFPKDTKLDAYQETLDIRVNKLSSDTNFLNKSIGNGSILIFQMNSESIEKVKNEEGEFKINFEFEFPNESDSQDDTESKTKLPLKLFKQVDFNNDKNPLKTIENFINAENVITLEVYNYVTPQKPLFLIQLPREMKIAEAKKYIIKAAFKNGDEKGNEKDIDMTSVLLFRMKNDQITKIDINKTCSYEILRLHFSNNDIPNGSKYHKMYYYITNTTGHKNNQEFVKYMAQYSADAKTIDFEKSVYAKKGIKCSDLFNSFKSFFSNNENENNDDDNDGSLNDALKTMFDEKKNMRYLLVQERVIESVFTRGDSQLPYDARNTFRVEVVPDQQIGIPQANLLRCFYSLDYVKQQSFGQPFIIEVVQNEPFNDTKNRIRNYMDLPQTDSLETYRFYLTIDGSSDLLITNASTARAERASKVLGLEPKNQEEKQATENATDNGEVKSTDDGEVKSTDDGEVKSNEDDSVSKYSIAHYNVKDNHGTKIVSLDDFAVLSEFMADGSFQMQLVIVPSRVDDKTKREVQAEHRVNVPARAHPSSHNDIKIYN